MDELTIAPALPGDLPEVLGLYAQLYPDDPPIDPARTMPIFMRILDVAGSTMLIARENGVLVGSCLFVITLDRPHADRLFGIVEHVVTAPRRRGAGIGRALLDAALRKAWDEGCEKVLLSLGDEPEAAAHLYANVGAARKTATHFKIMRPRQAVPAR